MVGNAKLAAPAGVEYTSINDIMYGHHGRGSGAVPSEIGRRQPTRPVVGVHHVGYPVEAATTLSNLSRRQRQPGETQMVIGPIATFRPGIYGAGPIIQFRRVHEIK